MLGWELPPHNSGGLGVACYQMCKALAQKGVSIQFILPYTAEHGIDFMEVKAAHPQSVASVKRAGGAYDSWDYLQFDRRGRKFGRSLFDQQAIYEYNVERLVDIDEFDIVHAHDWMTFRAAMALKRKSGIPLIVHLHATESDRSAGNGGNSLVREIEYQAMMMADKVVAVSQTTKDILTKEYKVTADKIEVVHNSIDLQDQQEQAGMNIYHYLETMKLHGYKVVTNVGRLTIQKGLTHLLEAARLVVDKNPKTLFLIVGSGEQYQELVELAADLGIGQNVLFAGFQRGKAVDDAYRVSDLFVMPSVSEPFGITPLEAIAQGSPALVSNQSGVKEVVRNLLRVDYWDSREMASQILGVLNSPELRDTLARYSQDEVRAMSWLDTADKLSELYGRSHQGASV
ncbi:MAG TPA: glycosyltransferase family 4 protein [Candidatus Saccharimonadales bacterium]